MISSITNLAARERAADLRRVAEQRRRIPTTHQPNVEQAADRPALSLRIADADEGQVVRDLAALDDARVLGGDVLLAIINGEAVAALSLHDGRVVANPFVRTDAAIALLRLRADHVSSRRRRRRWPIVPRPRFA